MITISNLQKRYRGKLVLQIANLNVSDGEFIGIVGNNGAGKTTLLRLLLDLIQPDEGEIISGKTSIVGSDEWKACTGSYLDEAFLIDFLTPEEFFYFVGNAYGFSKANIDKKLIDYQQFFNNEILGHKKKYIRDYSKGNKQKIGICSALLIEPSVLVLDEPFDALDPRSQSILRVLLSGYNRKAKATIILSSHDLNHVTELSQRIVVIEEGKIVRDMANTEGTFQELEKYFSVDDQTGVL